MSASEHGWDWQLLDVREGFEYYALTHPELLGDRPDGLEPDVYRRRVSDWNVTMPDGRPSGLRYEGSLSWYRQYIMPASKVSCMYGNEE